jgi:hypothetical protein
LSTACESATDFADSVSAPGMICAANGNAQKAEQIVARRAAASDRVIIGW